MRVDADDISRDVDAGAPPRLGPGHPSGAARRSDPPLTELALSRRGAGVRVIRTPVSERSVACEFPQWVATCPWHPGFPRSAIRSQSGSSTTFPRFRARRPERAQEPTSQAGVSLLRMAG